MKILQGSADHASGRNTFGLSGLFGKSEDGVDGNETFYGSTFSYNRILTPEISLSSVASYDRSEFPEEGRDDDTYRANVGLNYALSSSAQASFTYFFQKRESDQADQDYYENAVTLAIGVSF